METGTRIGFIGLGVMGGPMCQNLLQKGAGKVVVFDLSPERTRRLQELGAQAAGSVAELAADADVVMLSLPGGPQLEHVVAGDGGLLSVARRGQIVVDHSTAPVGLTRDLARRLGERGIEFADAPVARTRQAARTGTLAMSVGASPEVFEKIRPLLELMATDIVHCGAVGCGQIVKIMNNMVLFDTVVALSEAMTIGERSGVDRELLFTALSKGSADSFALRNHGMKAMAPGNFPEEAFSVEYALKDLGYALQLAEEAGIGAAAAELARGRLEKALAAGFGRQYFPVLARVVDGL